MSVPTLVSALSPRLHTADTATATVVGEVALAVALAAAPAAAVALAVDPTHEVVAATAITIITIITIATIVPLRLRLQSLKILMIWPIITLLIHRNISLFHFTESQY